MSQSYSPCAACKYLRRKCTNECVFGAYFPQEEPKKFADIHKVFGASNVAKILNDLPEAQREVAVESLAYEAHARLRDPVYGSMRLIFILKHRLKQYQTDLYNAQKELSAYVGPSAMLPIQPLGNYIPQYQHNSAGSATLPYNMQQAQMMGGLPPNVASPPMVIQQQLQYQKMTDSHQEATAAAAAVREQELWNTCEQQQQEAAQQVGQQQSEQLLMYDTGCWVPAGGGWSNQISVSEATGPALALGSFGGPYQIQQQTQKHPHLHHIHSQIQVQQPLLEQQEQQQILSFAQPLQVDPQQQQQILSFAEPLQVDPQRQLLHRDGSEGEGGSVGGPTLGPFNGPYQIQQHTQEHPHLHPHYHHQLELQQLLPEQQQQRQILSLAQPLHVDAKLQLEQHRDGSEEEGGGNGDPNLGSFDDPYHIHQHTQDHPPLHHYHHQLEVPQPWPEQQQQQQILALKQPLQVDPQHRDGSEEGGSNTDPR